MAAKTDLQNELARLQAARDAVRTSIANIEENGQSWRKGGSGFSVEMANLPSLYSRERELSSQIATIETSLEYL